MPARRPRPTRQPKAPLGAAKAGEPVPTVGDDGMVHVPDPIALGKPTLAGDVPIPDVRPEDIPPAAPGEAPDKTDDTSNVALDTLVWLKGCKAVLLAEGFKRDPLRQARKPGQVWGVVRQEPDHMQIHVRAFKDGRLETEHELSNRYVQHLWSHRWGAHEAVKDILAKHGMPTSLVSETFQPITGTKAGKKMPKGRTKTTHLIAVGAAALVAFLAFRQVRKRLLGR